MSYVQLFQSIVGRRHSDNWIVLGTGQQPRENIRNCSDHYDAGCTRRTDDIGAGRLSPQAKEAMWNGVTLDDLLPSEYALMRLLRSVREEYTEHIVGLERVLGEMTEEKQENSARCRYLSDYVAMLERCVVENGHELPQEPQSQYV